MAELAKGDVVATKYEVLHEVARGGMGIVYAARDLVLPRDVAIKVVDDTALKRIPGVIDRFHLEARTAATLENSHAVRIYDIGDLDDGRPYLVMELLKGEDLEHFLATHGCLRVPQAIDYLLQALEVLAEAHSRGIVHRDIKPANLFVDRRDRAPRIKVLDFGVAAVVRDAAATAAANLTGVGGKIGTPFYMAPEQHRGQPVDGRADLWAIGVVLYQMLEGRRPFDGPSLVSEILEKPPPAARRDYGASQARVEGVLTRCLEKDRDKRYPDATSLAAALAELRDLALADASRERVALESASTEVRRPDVVQDPTGDPTARTEVVGKINPDPVVRVEGDPPAVRPGSMVFGAPLSSESDLVDALVTDMKRKRQVTFLVGSGLSLPNVPGVDGIIELLRLDYDSEEERVRFDAAIKNETSNRYQRAFRKYLATHRQEDVNRIIRLAVLQARADLTSPDVAAASQLDPSEAMVAACKALEKDVGGWRLTPGVESLGRLLVEFHSTFGATVLTPNFDPLIEMSVLAAGGRYARTVLDDDGRLQQTESSDDTTTQVVHYHGYWYGRDTLHTRAQLNQRRPKLQSSIRKLIRGSRLVVVAYGGWDDAFMSALKGVVEAGDDDFNLSWTFLQADPDEIGKNYSGLIRDLLEGGDRGRVQFCAGVDARTFFAKLRASLAGRSLPPPPPPAPTPEPPEPAPDLAEPASPKPKPSEQPGPASHKPKPPDPPGPASHKPKPPDPPEPPEPPQPAPPPRPYLIALGIGFLAVAGWASSLRNPPVPPWYSGTLLALGVATFLSSTFNINAKVETEKWPILPGHIQIGGTFAVFLIVLLALPSFKKPDRNKNRIDTGASASSQKAQLPASNQKAQPHSEGGAAPEASTPAHPASAPDSGGSGHTPAPPTPHPVPTSPATATPTSKPRSEQPKSNDGGPKEGGSKEGGANVSNLLGGSCSDCD